MTSRRTLLTGLAAGATGVAGVVFGSGAFTTVEADRDFDVGLAESDDEAQLVIEETDPGSVAIDDDDGEFSINAQGIQPNGITTIGEFGTSDEGDLSDDELISGAFVIRNENETGANVDVTVQISSDDGDLDPELILVLDGPDNGSEQAAVDEEEETTIEDVPSTEDGSEETPEGVDEADAEIECGLFIDTRGVEAPEENEPDIDVTLSIEAVRSDLENLD